jgi:hypothetical protein
MAAGALAAFGVAALWTSAQWSFGTPRLLGPAAMPALASLLIAVPATALLLRLILAGPRAADGRAMRGTAQAGMLRILATIMALLAYTVALRPLGFLATTMPFLAILYALVAPKGKLRFALAVSVGVGLGAFALFDLLLQVPLPRGTIWGG